LATKIAAAGHPYRHPDSANRPAGRPPPQLNGELNHAPLRGKSPASSNAALSFLCPMGTQD